MAVAVDQLLREPVRLNPHVADAGHTHPPQPGPTAHPVCEPYWWFRLDAVAGRILYADLLRGTEPLWEMNARIEGFRKSIEPRRWQDIPL